jgi:hypothetical protein
LKKNINNAKLKRKSRSTDLRKASLSRKTNKLLRRMMQRQSRRNRRKKLEK